MGFFSSSKKIDSSKELKRALRNAKSLSYSERKKLARSLKKDLDDGGINNQELKRSIREFKRDTSDGISRYEAKDLKDALSDD